MTNGNATWPQNEVRPLLLERFDERLGRYRLAQPKLEKSMAQSLQRYGQVSPVIVCLHDSEFVLIDGFKRLRAARTLQGMTRLTARRLDVDEAGAKAALYNLNCITGRPAELEESWIVHALVREDGLSQVETAKLLGRHKSWVSRRLAMLERLCDAAQEELRLGLLVPAIARDARDLGVSRWRVRRVVGSHTAARDDGALSSELPASVSLRKSKLDSFETVIRQLLARYPEITATRVFEELKREGYAGGYTILRDRVKRMRTRPIKPLVVRFETDPGVQAQMDWAVYDIDFSGEGRRRVNLFSYLLGYSRRQYLCFTERQDFEATVRQHILAFKHLQGLAATCLYDNMKVVVTRWEDDEPIYNTRFLAFATHYGYRPWACLPRRPETKGKVERRVRPANLCSDAQSPRSPRWPARQTQKPATPKRPLTSHTSPKLSPRQTAKVVRAKTANDTSSFPRRRESREPHIRG